MPNHIQTIPFCVSLPSSEGTGVVGTITLRGQSAIIWFGWGDIEPCENDETVFRDRDVGETLKVGNGELTFDCFKFLKLYAIYLLRSQLF